MKTLFTFLMPLLIAVTFTVSNKLFAQADYYSAAVFYIVSFCTTSLWITIISSKKLIVR
jgi:hypothetical protein